MSFSRSLARSASRLAACGVVALSLLATPAHAQGATVHLTMDRMARMYNGMKELAILGFKHPELADAITMDGDSTADWEVSRLSSKPLVVAALARAGTTPREYVATSVAYLGAAMAYGMLKTMPGAKLPPETDAANVAFVRAHEAQIAALQQQMEAEVKKVAPPDASSD